jgi:HPt (histidine-containing phosphotransfer) domain-containing protein
LTIDYNIDIAKEELKASISLPLETKGFDAVCHFLGGSLSLAGRRDIQSLVQTLEIQLDSPEKSGQVEETRTDVQQILIFCHYFM